MRPAEEHHARELRALDRDVEAELLLAQGSCSDGPVVAADADVAFDVAAVSAYEVRLRGLRDAVVELESVVVTTVLVTPASETPGAPDPELR